MGVRSSILSIASLPFLIISTFPLSFPRLLHPAHSFYRFSSPSTPLLSPLPSIFSYFLLQISIVHFTSHLCSRLTLQLASIRPILSSHLFPSKTIHPSLRNPTTATTSHSHNRNHVPFLPSTVDRPPSFDMFLSFESTKSPFLQRRLAVNRAESRTCTVKLGLLWPWELWFPLKDIHGATQRSRSSSKDVSNKMELMAESSTAKVTWRPAPPKQ